jgi:hypothetical protein
MGQALHQGQAGQEETELAPFPPKRILTETSQSTEIGPKPWTGHLYLRGPQKSLFVGLLRAMMG